MAWDSTKPATSSALASAEVRGDFAAVEGAVGGVNLLADPTFLLWAAGDAAAPTHWTLTGAGAAVARTGTGLGDTKTKVGPYSAKVTAGGGAVAFLNQSLLTTTSFDISFQSRTVAMGAWVWASAGSAARLRIDDGVTSSFSAFHAGSSAWVWLTLTATLNAAATKITAGLECAISQVGYISGPTFLLGLVPPSNYQPAPMERDTIVWRIAGNQSTGTVKMVEDIDRPCIVRDIQLFLGTAPATQALIVDINSWDGAALTSMFSGAGAQPQVAAAANRGNARPDGTYARRCLSGAWGTVLSAGSTLSLDIDQVGVGTVGADLVVMIRLRYYARPLEAFLEYNQIA